ncbi:MAG: metallophosphatase domain-containing protein [Moraxellaceae bacterium]|nr:metallophosphatase domain-containing protein [Moraxellaceae bacterium]MCP5176958.1 metallophosphatase domain-containing protein [Moraxellaceae bacterium]
MPSPLKLVIISDTHGLHELLTIPDGDMLIHAGDMTEYGELDEIKAFDDWLGTLPHKHKIVIAGNHEHCLEEHDGHLLFKNAIYLQHQAITIEGIRFFGSPWQPFFHNMAFNLRRGQDLAEKWQQIPSNTDILITHTPPFKYLDRVRSQWVGCEDLLKRVQELKPKLHIFGHIHESYGQEANRHTLFVNACSVLELDAPLNKPVIVNWPL